MFSPASLRLVASLLLLPFGCNAAPGAPEQLVSKPPPAPVETSRTPPAPPRVVAGGIALEVRETAGVARQGEVVRSGIPLPRALEVRDPASLTVVDPSGRPVPAAFRVLARWNAGVSRVDAPIQWLLVEFPASVEARGRAVYRLRTDGAANPAPPRPLRLTREGGRITVDTGAAVFRLGADPGALFDEVRLASGEDPGRRLASGGELSLTVEGKTGRHPETRRIRIEQAGRLSAVVLIEGAYDLEPIGKGGFGSRRRYVFTAGSPTALVRHAVAWEGNLHPGCKGCVQTKEGRPNGVLVEKVRDVLALDLEAIGGAPGSSPASSPTLSVLAVGDREAPAVEAAGVVGAKGMGEIARVRQLLRPERKAPLAFEVEAAGRKASGDRADGGLLAAAGPGGGLAVALGHMHRYEPEALRLLADGRLAVDLADDRVWLAHHQGLFATLAVSALPPGPPSRKDLDRLVWAPLNQPLRAWPDNAWFAASGAVDLPAGELPRGLGSYDDLVRGVLAKTEEMSAAEGLSGLMTFGVYPRYWGRWDSVELRCKRDPTPNDRWDDAFWCSTWTDYHNTLSTVPLWAMRTGEVEWLDEIAFPGAQRTLHTQIMQCGPDERWFYCGQAPAGYAGYRADFNSSHAYFENLFLYYWLTGDSTVPDILRRGGENMRRRMCASRGPQPVTDAKGPDGPACAAGEPPDKAGFSGRVGGQWLAALRFLGLASEDASFLEDWRSGIARMVTHHYAELEWNGRRYGLLGDVPVRSGTGGEGTAGPLWTNAFYDGENLYRFQRDTGDEPVGEPALRPSRVLAAVARTLADIEDGPLKKELRGAWPRLLAYTWEGDRIGGRIVTIAAKGRKLYGPERAGMVALLVRAGQQTGDRHLLETGLRMAKDVLSASRGEQVPLGKLQGQYLTRLHGALGSLAVADPIPVDPIPPRTAPLPRSGGEGSPPAQ